MMIMRMRNLLTTERLFYGGLALFITLFFGVIALNAIDHSERRFKFKEACEGRGGVMVAPVGVKGWIDPECRNKASFILID